MKAVRNNTGAARHTERTSRIPSAPTYRFDGKVQPPAFAAGVESFRAFMIEVDESTARLDDSDFTERYAPQIAAQIAKGGAFGLGYAAALANWLALRAVEQQARKLDALEGREGAPPPPAPPAANFNTQPTPN